MYYEFVYFKVFLGKVTQSLLMKPLRRVDDIVFARYPYLAIHSNRRV